MDERYAYWLAALIDGEGSIITRWRKGRGRPSIVIVIAQNDRRLLDRAIEFAECGTVYQGQGPRKNGCQLQIFRQDDVRRILTAVAPLLVLKAEKAQAALAALPTARWSNAVEHGGGLSGKKNCPCTPCKDRKAAYMQTYKRPSRKPGGIAQQAEQLAHNE